MLAFFCAFFVIIRKSGPIPEYTAPTMRWTLQLPTNVVRKRNDLLNRVFFNQYGRHFSFRCNHYTVCCCVSFPSNHRTSDSNRHRPLIDSIQRVFNLKQLSRRTECSERERIRMIHVTKRNDEEWSFLNGVKGYFFWKEARWWFLFAQRRWSSRRWSWLSAFLCAMFSIMVSITGAR